MVTSNARVRKSMEFSHIPTSLFYDLRLSLDSRAVLGWALGCPDGWDFRIGHMCHKLGIGDKKWPRLRDEMVAAGYLYISKKRGPVFSKKANKIIENAIIWDYEFTDAPLLINSIPPNRGGGENSQNDSTPPKRRDGSGMSGKEEDYQEDLTTVVNNPPAPKARNTPEPEAQGAKPPLAGECIELFKKNEKWPELIGRVKKSSQKHFRGQLLQLTLRGGGAVSDKHVAAIMDYLERAHNVIGVMQGILDKGGWDPVRLSDAARPGETASQAKNRLANELQDHRSNGHEHEATLAGWATTKSPLPPLDRAKGKANTDEIKNLLKEDPEKTEGHAGPAAL